MALGILLVFGVCGVVDFWRFVCVLVMWFSGVLISCEWCNIVRLFVRFQGLFDCGLLANFG